MSHRETTLDMEAFLEDMPAALEVLDSFSNYCYDPTFAKNLTAFYKKNGYLTDKQKYVAARFWREVNEKAPLSSGIKRPTQVIKKSLEIDGKKMIELFDRAASEGLKYPTITYWVPANEVVENVAKLRFYRAGFQSKEPGAINVVQPGSYSDSTYLGTIARNGSVSFSIFCNGKFLLQALLKKVIEEADEGFKINGKKVGSCCFCAKELTAGPSLQVGYGPICAARWGLPWGEEELPKEMDVSIL